MICFGDQCYIEKIRDNQVEIQIQFPPVNNQVFLKRINIVSNIPKFNLQNPQLSFKSKTFSTNVLDEVFNKIEINVHFTKQSAQESLRNRMQKYQRLIREELQPLKFQYLRLKQKYLNLTCQVLQIKKQLLNLSSLLEQ